MTAAAMAPENTTYEASAASSDTGGGPSVNNAIFSLPLRSNGKPSSRRSNFKPISALVLAPMDPYTYPGNDTVQAVYGVESLLHYGLTWADTPDPKPMAQCVWA